MERLIISVARHLDGRVKPWFPDWLTLFVRRIDRGKSVIIGCILAAWVTCLTPPVAVADDADLLRLRIFHRSAEDFQKEACPWLGSTMTRIGGRFLEVFPVGKIAAVEVQADETILPSALLLRAVMEGRFVDRKRPISPDLFPTGRLWLKDGNCMAINVLLDPAGDQIAGVSTSMGYVSVPSLPDKCSSFVARVKPGITRAEVEKLLTLDGGRFIPFLYERYVIPNSACGDNGEAIKVNLAFKPAGMSDAAYLLGSSPPPKPNSKDTVVRVSPRYLERPNWD